MTELPHHSIFQTLENSVMDGLNRADAKLIDSLLDSKFVGVGLMGITYTREEFLKHITTTIVIRQMSIRSIRAIEETGFAVVVSDWTVDLTSKSSIVIGSVRVSRVWVQRGSEWKILSFHTSDARMGESWEAMTKKAPGASITGA